MLLISINTEAGEPICHLCLTQCPSTVGKVILERKGKGVQMLLTDLCNTKNIHLLLVFLTIFQISSADFILHLYSTIFFLF